MKKDKKRIIRITSLTLALLLALQSFSFAKPAEHTNVDVEKFETVFVNLSAEGRQKEEIVSNWLKNPASVDMITDRTSLNGVQSISGDNRAVRDGEVITWETNGQDLYYQGRTDKELPIETGVEYYLNGRKMTPEEIAGKTGEVKIVLKVANKQKESFVKEGISKSVCTPFTVVAVVGLPTETFSDVEVDNGKMFSDGSSQMVIFIGFPSLKESLNIGNASIEEIKNLNIPDTLTITAYARKFELSSIGIIATPELPDMLKDIEKREDLDENRSDLNRLIRARDEMEAADPQESIKGLVTSQEKTENARKMVEDIFGFYELDKELFDVMPDYITDKNIGLFERVKRNLKEAEFRHLMDNQVLKYIPDRLNDENIQKSRVLLEDYDELKTFEEERVDKAVELLDDYEELQPLIQKSSQLYDKVRDGEEALDTLEALTRHRDNAEHFLDRAQALGISGDITNEDIEAMIDTLKARKSGQVSHSAPISGLVGALEQVFAVNPNPPALPQELMAGLQQLGIGQERVNEILSSQSENKLEELKVLISASIDSAVSQQVNSSVDEVKDLLHEYKDLKRELEDDMGYAYENDIKQALDFVDGLMPLIREVRDLEKKNRDQVEKAIDLTKNEEDILYMQYWSHRIKDMKKNMEDNEENIEIIRDVLEQYDDPKIKHFYSMIPTLRKDAEELRPVAESFSNLTDEKKYNDSLHKSPETIKRLLEMKSNLEDNREITDTMKRSLDDKVIEVARDVIEIMDRRDAQGDLERARKDLNSLTDLMDRKNAIEALSEGYTSFTGSASSIKSNVRFVMKTDPVEKEEVKKEVQTPEEKPGFWKRIFRWKTKGERDEAKKP